VVESLCLYLCFGGGWLRVKGLKIYKYIYIYTVYVHIFILYI